MITNTLSLHLRMDVKDVTVFWINVYTNNILNYIKDRVLDISWSVNNRFLISKSV